MPVYTTRPDTLFGVTFMAVDPAHEIARKLAARHGRAAQLESFVQTLLGRRSARRRMMSARRWACSSAPTAAIPFTGERVPIVAANYVVAEYGFGAVMGVPAHDQRDFEFVKTVARSGPSNRHQGRDPVRRGPELRAEDMTEAVRRCRA